MQRCVIVENSVNEGGSCKKLVLPCCLHSVALPLQVHALGTVRNAETSGPTLRMRVKPF